VFVSDEENYAGCSRLGEAVRCAWLFCFRLLVARRWVSPAGQQRLFSLRERFRVTGSDGDKAGKRGDKRRHRGTKRDKRGRHAQKLAESDKRRPQASAGVKRRQLATMATRGTRNDSKEATSSAGQRQQAASQHQRQQASKQATTTALSEHE